MVPFAAALDVDLGLFIVPDFTPKGAQLLKVFYAAQVRARWLTLGPAAIPATLRVRVSVASITPLSADLRSPSLDDLRSLWNRPLSPLHNHSSTCVRVLGRIAWRPRAHRRLCWR